MYNMLTRNLSVVLIVFIVYVYSISLDALHEDTYPVRDFDPTDFVHTEKSLTNKGITK